MNKTEFICGLYEKLPMLTAQDIDEHLSFYLEIIDDRIEEGVSEEEAISQIGTLDEIASQIVAQIPISKLVKEKISRKKNFKTWEIVLLALGSPIWFSILIAAFAVIFSAYVSLWAVIISLWSVFASLVACVIGGLLACVILAVGGNGASGLIMLSAGIVCAGLSIFMFYGCKVLTKGMLVLTKKMAIWIKNCFIKKEVA